MLVLRELLVYMLMLGEFDALTTGSARPEPASLRVGSWAQCTTSSNLDRRARSRLLLRLWCQDVSADHWTLVQGTWHQAIVPLARACLLRLRFVHTIHISQPVHKNCTCEESVGQHCLGPRRDLLHTSAACCASPVLLLLSLSPHFRTRSSNVRDPEAIFSTTASVVNT